MVVGLLVVFALCSAVLSVGPARAQTQTYLGTLTVSPQPGAQNAASWPIHIVGYGLYPTREYLLVFSGNGRNDSLGIATTNSDGVFATDANPSGGPGGTYLVTATPALAKNPALNTPPAPGPFYVPGISAQFGCASNTGTVILAQGTGPPPSTVATSVPPTTGAPRPPAPSVLVKVFGFVPGWKAAFALSGPKGPVPGTYSLDIGGDGTGSFYLQQVPGWDPATLPLGQYTVSASGVPPPQIDSSFAVNRWIVSTTFVNESCIPPTTTSTSTTTTSTTTTTTSTTTTTTKPITTTSSTTTTTTATTLPATTAPPSTSTTTSTTSTTTSPATTSTVKITTTAKPATTVKTITVVKPTTTVKPTIKAPTTTRVPTTTRARPTTTKKPLVITSVGTTTTVHATTTTTKPPPPVTLRIDPPIGRPGFVATALGSGFSAGSTVVLQWVNGLGRVTIKVGADGKFRVPVLIFSHERPGAHRLQWIANPKVTAPFLVVSGPMSPGGSARTIRFGR